MSTFIQLLCASKRCSGVQGQSRAPGRRSGREAKPPWNWNIFTCRFWTCNGSRKFVCCLLFRNAKKSHVLSCKNDANKSHLGMCIIRRYTSPSIFFGGGNSQEKDKGKGTGQLPPCSSLAPPMDRSSFILTRVLSGQITGKSQEICVVRVSQGKVKKMILDHANCRYWCFCISKYWKAGKFAAFIKRPKTKSVLASEGLCFLTPRPCLSSFVVWILLH